MLTLASLTPLAQILTLSEKPEDRRSSVQALSSAFSFAAAFRATEAPQSRALRSQPQPPHAARTTLLGAWIRTFGRTSQLNAVPIPREIRAECLSALMALSAVGNPASVEDLLVELESFLDVKSGTLGDMAVSAAIERVSRELGARFGGQLEQAMRRDGVSDSAASMLVRRLILGSADAVDWLALRVPFERVGRRAWFELGSDELQAADDSLRRCVECVRCCGYCLRFFLALLACLSDPHLI